ncbi:MAG: InlB B-repeat-containing protein, partial [Ruminiclostridium sp.]|nr:InlB B-repeat-containing protein [Ruminiclostridium sp.]
TGWYTGKTGGKKIDTSTKIKRSGTVYAHWKKTAEGEFTVTFDTRGGTLNTVSRATKDQKLAKLYKPVRPGYVFDGWYTSASGGKKIKTSTIYRKDTTVFAHWTRDDSLAYRLDFGTRIAGGKTKVTFSPEGIAEADVRLVRPDGDVDGIDGNIIIYFDGIKPGTTDVTVSDINFDGEVNESVSFRLTVNEKLKVTRSEAAQKTPFEGTWTNARGSKKLTVTGDHAILRFYNDGVEYTDFNGKIKVDGYGDLRAANGGDLGLYLYLTKSEDDILIGYVDVLDDTQTDEYIKEGSDAVFTTYPTGFTDLGTDELESFALTLEGSAPGVKSNDDLREWVSADSIYVGVTKRYDGKLMANVSIKKNGSRSETMRNEVTPEFLKKIAEVMKKYDLLGSNPSKYPESIYTPVQWIMSGSFTNKRRFSVALYEPFPDEATAAILRLFRDALPKEN